MVSCLGIESLVVDENASSTYSLYINNELQGSHCPSGAGAEHGHCVHDSSE